MKLNIQQLVMLLITLIYNKKNNLFLSEIDLILIKKMQNFYKIYKKIYKKNSK